MMRFDVAVIGGGPAGSSAARRLARAGASVLLLERRPMPRPKPCGGALSARGLGSLDFPLPETLVDSRVFGVRIHVNDDMYSARLPNPIAVLVTRSRFDHFLVSKAEEAGARVAWKSVARVEVRPDEVLLHASDVTYSARCAIICDGANGNLSRLVRPLDPKDRQLFSLMVEVPAAAFGRSLNDDGMLDIYYRILDWGYGWVFHHGTYCSVGITGLASLMTQPREAFQRFLASRNIPGERLPIRGRFIPCGGFQRRLCADRVLLAGDAAGLADPFQGEGIAYAIRSGRLAAETALTAEAHKDFSSESLAPFERACREAFDADLRHSLTLARVLRWWPSLIVKAMAGGPDVLQRYVRIATGEFTYREFIKWFAPRALWRWANAFVADRARARKGLQSTGLGTT